MKDVIALILFFIIGYYATTGTKSQFIRLLDVLVYGPILIWFGATRSKTTVERIFLYFMGATTISYNLRNILIYRKQQDGNCDCSWRAFKA